MPGPEVQWQDYDPPAVVRRVWFGHLTDSSWSLHLACLLLLPTVASQSPREAQRERSHTLDIVKGLKGKLSEISCHRYTVRKSWAHFAACDLGRYCKALCDVKFSQIERNGRKVSLVEKQ